MTHKHTHKVVNVLFYAVSLPHLVDFDWRVDVKTSSDSVARMAQPTCLVQMKVPETHLLLELQVLYNAQYI